MQAEERWQALGWRHAVWDLVRYFCALARSRTQQAKFVEDLRRQASMTVGRESTLAIPREDVTLFLSYLEARETQLTAALSRLRDEKEALELCSRNGWSVEATTTQSQDHHQSSKALIAAVSNIATRVVSRRGLTLEANPQSRCVWLERNQLHVTARNLDGAIPGLTNPRVVWEIKEYWGKTSGGSKMSDAVYECNLVGRELREYEERSRVQVEHVVFVDGREQWHARKSDLARFVDLLNQGLINALLVGRDVETDWERSLGEMLDRAGLGAKRG